MTGYKWFRWGKGDCDTSFGTEMCVECSSGKRQSHHHHYNEWHDLQLPGCSAFHCFWTQLQHRHVLPASRDTNHKWCAYCDLWSSITERVCLRYRSNKWDQLGYCVCGHWPALVSMHRSRRTAQVEPWHLCEVLEFIYHVHHRDVSNIRIWHVYRRSTIRRSSRMLENFVYKSMGSQELLALRFPPRIVSVLFRSDSYKNHQLSAHCAQVHPPNPHHSDTRKIKNMPIVIFIAWAKAEQRDV